MGGSVATGESSDDVQKDRDHAVVVERESLLAANMYTSSISSMATGLSVRRRAPTTDLPDRKLRTMIVLALLSLLTSLPPRQPAAASQADDVIARAALALDAPVVATLSARGNVSILDAKTGAVHEKFERSISVKSPSELAISPRGDLIAVLDTAARVHLVDWASDEPALVLDLMPEGEARGKRGRFADRVEFAPQGERLVASSRESGAVLFDRSGNELARCERLGGAWFDAPWAWSGNGERLAILSADGVRLLEGSSGDLIDVEFELGSLSARAVDLDHGGERIAVGGKSHTLWLFDDRGVELWRRVIKFPSDPFLDLNAAKKSLARVEFSPNEQMIAVTTASSSAAAIVATEDGGQFAEGLFRGGRMGEPRGITWSEDSTRIYHAFISGALGVFSIEVERKEGELVAAPEKPFEVEPGHASLPTRGWNGHGLQLTQRKLVLLDLRTGKSVWKRKR